MLYQIFKQVQQNGVMSLEPHFEDPTKSSILTKYPKFLAKHEAVDFLADSVKVLIVGGIAPHDLEALIDEDLRAHHDEALRPAAALTKIGDALPGLGIVAAVLGIVITMGHIDGPPAEIGHHVGAALVGTFLGILLSYGVAAPIAQLLEQRVNDDAYYNLCIKAGLLAVYKGNPPAIAVEFARRVLPSRVPPELQRDRAVLPQRGCGTQSRGGGSMSTPASANVIIIKKKGHHKHAHHGGAWKVAYADFVTAMMAFFLVMWLVGQSPRSRRRWAATSAIRARSRRVDRACCRAPRPG